MTRNLSQLVVEHRARLRDALDLLDKEWPSQQGGISLLPEDSKEVPWPVRNFVRRVRAVLEESEGGDE